MLHNSRVLSQVALESDFRADSHLRFRGEGPFPARRLAQAALGDVTTAHARSGPPPAAGTTQAVIARIEGGKAFTASLDLLDRIARALGGRLSVEFEGIRPRAA